MSDAFISPSMLGECLDRLHEEAPLIQCVTNTVVMGFTANTLLAAGASPAMVDNDYEAGFFANIAQAVLINLGTPNDHTVPAMHAAVTTCRDSGTPWVLDPVACGALPWRTKVVAELLAISPPTILRGNASEISGLAGGSGGRGVDSVATADEVADEATRLALEHKTVVAVSGAIDFLTDGTRTCRIRNGHLWLTKVTGAGCALGALMAAAAAVEPDPLIAAAAATALLTIAADRAAETSCGTGTFAVQLIDQISVLSGDQIATLVDMQ